MERPDDRNIVTWTDESFGRNVKMKIKTSFKLFVSV